MSLPTILSVLLTATFSFAQAESSRDPQELPINLVADSGEYDANTGIATYIGNVSISQGDMNITGDKVVVRLEKGQVESVESWGSLATFHYVPKADPPIDGKGKYMKYTVATSIVDIKGNAYIKQENNETKADVLSYNLKEERVKGKRVNMILIPKSK